MNPKYKDLLHLPHPISLKHPRMDAIDRAAQFSPFAALTGYDAAINETARETHKKVDLDEEEKNKLDEYLSILLFHIKEKPKVLITYFKADEKKQGGSYKTIVNTIKKVNKEKSSLIMENGIEIMINDIIAIERQS